MGHQASDDSTETLLLRIADTSMIHSQRLAQWCGHAPMLEEDLALSNIALDLLGQARLLYQALGAINVESTRHQSEDHYAFWRDEEAFLNLTLVELPNGLTLSSGPRDDYAVTLAKLFLSSAYFLPYWTALCQAPFKPLSDIAHKSVKEARYHWEHASQWMLRMGDGTDESHARAQAALNRLWPYCNEMFDDDALDRQGQTTVTGVLPSALRGRWDHLVNDILKEAGLARPIDSNMLSKGRYGGHSECFGVLLAEMQSLARKHPGAQW
jgi:ring-1,2-phenylacetyl-CoA epoxidase subunit PaaC